MKGKLYCVRHGQSEWNKKNLFTGWVDVSLSSKGIEEAQVVGDRLSNVDFDVVFTSNLIRAEMSAMLILAKNHLAKVPYRVHESDGKNYEVNEDSILKEMLPVFQSEALNERMYGKLQGMNKDIARKLYGEEQVLLWRRSYDQNPPEGESLKMTKARTLPYFNQRVLPLLQQGKTVLIVAHGNSLRSIIMELMKMTEEQILRYELQTGEPVYLELEQEKWILKALH